MRVGALCYLLLALACGVSLFLPRPLWAAVVLINLLTLLIYGADKLAAIRAWQRVPESTLLVFGLVGGWPGAICGQQLFRHKTCKQPFKTWFICSVVLNLALAIGYWRYGG